MAREAWPFLIPLGVGSLICWLLFRSTAFFPFGYLGGIALALAGFVAFFFRDPERGFPLGEGLVVSAGDGRVVAVEPVEHDAWLEGPGVRISVFLSIFDVHVNRIPFSGRVGRLSYRPGRFFLAFAPKASEENEQNVVCIQAGSCRLVVKQIAGFVARRIVCRISEGDSVVAGQRFGLIRFGSRIDHILPADATVRVKIGDRVRGGETVIGVISR